MYTTVQRFTAKFFDRTAFGWRNMELRIAISGSYLVRDLQTLLEDTIKEDSEALLEKYQDHLIGTENKWVKRLELSAITQQESVEEFIWRLKTKEQACSYTEESRDEQIAFQIIKGLRWAEARRKLIEKGSDLKLDAAIKITLEYQAIISNTARFEQKSIDAVQRYNCSRCGSDQAPQKCPAYGEECTKCKTTLRRCAKLESLESIGQNLGKE